MSDMIAKAALKQGLKQAKSSGDELNELRKKVKHQEAMLRSLTQELGRLEKMINDQKKQALAEENERNNNQRITNLQAATSVSMMKGDKVHTSSSSSSITPQAISAPPHVPQGTRRLRIFLK